MVYEQKETNVFGLNARPYPSFPTNQMAVLNGYLVHLNARHGRTVRANGFRVPVYMVNRAYWRFVEFSSMDRPASKEATHRIDAILGALRREIEKRKRNPEIRRLEVQAPVPDLPGSQAGQLVALIERGDDEPAVIKLVEERKEEAVQC